LSILIAEGRVRRQVRRSAPGWCSARRVPLQGVAGNTGRHLRAIMGRFGRQRGLGAAARRDRWSDCAPAPTRPLSVFSTRSAT